MDKHQARPPEIPVTIINRDTGRNHVFMTRTQANEALDRLLAAEPGVREVLVLRLMGL
jgi:hypothetical protein